MKIVAEGIETREQVDFLTTMDCDLIQGYYFAKPMPVSDFEEKAFS
jgi:EAL domain-containing protein (putative c-di-GMP-specific phosphodiesterase class I)